MTVSSTTARVAYAGSGSSGPFPVPFRFDDPAHLLVLRFDVSGARTALAYPADYAASGAGTEGAGAVTLAAPLAAGSSLVVLPRVPLTQAVDYVANDAFPAAGHEGALDKLTRAAQMVNELALRAVTVPETEPAGGFSVPRLADRKGFLAAWDATTGAFEAWRPTADFDGAVTGAQTSATAAASSAAAASASATSAGSSAGAAAVSAASAANAAAGLTATSTTTLSIGTGAKSLTVQVGKQFAPGQFLVLADAAQPATNWMVGQATAYNGSTGALTVAVGAVAGSGSISNWTVTPGGPQGPQGTAGATGATGPAGQPGAWGAEASVTAAATTALSALVTVVTGTTTITSFGSAASLSNPICFVRFTGALTLTHHATNLVLPGAQNITTQAGDAGVFEYMGAGAWRCLGWFPAPRHSALEFVVDGAGSVPATGQKGWLEVPFDCQIVQATLLADQAGSAVVEVWRSTYAGFPPTAAGKITASSPPTLSSSQKAQDATLSGWTTQLSAGDVLAFNLASASTVTRLTLSLKVKRAA
jgi:hypothetical protein